MTIKQEFKKVERAAVALLDLVASSNEVPTSQQLQDLDWYAGQLSKLAYGNDRPELVVGEIYNLISWCDHTHEEEIKQQLTAALRFRPLVCPAWSSS